MLTPSSELPPLPRGVPGYRGVHAYTLAQIVATIIIFVVTFTKAAPVFPVLIIVLVPVRLMLMKRLWHRETLRHVDAWACREGTPEDDEDAATAAALAASGGGSGRSNAAPADEKQKERAARYQPATTTATTTTTTTMEV
jgi:hypothetical protein